LHHSLAWKMLHNAIIGPETADHPYFVAFIKGLLLPCGPLALNLSDIAKRYCGGTSEFVISLLDTRITGDYTMLRLDYSNKISEAMQTAIQDAMGLAFPALSNKGFPGLFREFLEGSGIPPPLTDQELRDRFADFIPLDDVSKKEFRMRMFCWASTGVPQILLDGPTIEASETFNNRTVFSWIITGLPGR
ncbi:hypothetical protein F5880DRAFT_1482647, partial [Lentinula raphanica]